MGPHNHLGCVCDDFHTRKLGLGGGIDLCKAIDVSARWLQEEGVSQRETWSLKVANGYSSFAKMST